MIQAIVTACTPRASSVPRCRQISPQDLRLRTHQLEVSELRKKVSLLNEEIRYTQNLVDERDGVIHDCNRTIRDLISELHETEKRLPAQSTANAIGFLFNQAGQGKQHGSLIRDIAADAELNVERIQDRTQYEMLLYIVVLSTPRLEGQLDKARLQKCLSITGN